MKRYPAIDPHRPGADLEAALRAVERRYHTRFTVHDCHALLFDGDGKLFLHERRRHRHPYCERGRSEEEGWDAACTLDCAFRAEAAGSRDPRPFRKTCWKGVCELVVPATREDTLLLLAYAGPFRPAGGKPPETLSAPWRRRWRFLPVWEEGKMVELARELALLLHGMLHYAEGAHGAEKPTHRRGQIRELLNSRAHEPSFRLADVCAALNLSPARTNRVINHHFGASFNRLLEAERMNRARHLLESTDLPLKNVANLVGYRNEYYFNRAFARHTGMPPGKYRRSMTP